MRFVHVQGNGIVNLMGIALIDGEGGDGGKVDSDFLVQISQQWTFGSG